jgi:8-oxo-dGTP diphosphatase
MIRRVGHAPHADHKYTLRPGAYAILPLGGAILLTVQMADRPDVQLPGGGIDPGESPLQALHREVLEETGWRIARPKRLGAFRRFVFMPEYELWAEKLCHVYVAHPVHRIQDASEPDHETMLLTPHDALDVLGNDGDRMYLSRFLLGSGVFKQYT